MPIINVPDTDSFDLWRQKTNLLAIEHGDFERLIVPMTFAIVGTVSSAGVVLTGIGTSFTTELVIGSIVRDTVTNVQRKIVAITSDTVAETDTAFTPALVGSTLATVDLITALNSAYSALGNVGRDTLIRAIAMS